MAVIYRYEDTYIVNSIEIDELERVESDALIDLGKQGITDEYYLEKMTKCLVYVELATRQGESESMQERVNNYRKEYLRYSQMDNFENIDSGVFSGKIGRA